MRSPLLWLVCASLLALVGCAGEPGDFEVEAASSALVTTDASNFALTGEVVVNYTGLSGSGQNWVSISPQGSGVYEYVSASYVSGTSGSITLPNIAAGGPYVARVVDDAVGPTVQQESGAFNLTGSTITPGGGSFNQGSAVSFTFANVPATTATWFTLAPTGSSVYTYANYTSNTGGASSGSGSMVAPQTGSFVIRAFRNNTYLLAGESAPFSVTNGGASITTNASNYNVGATITATYSGVPASTDAWFVLAPSGSDQTTVTDYRTNTAGTSSGTVTFSAPAPGSWVIRAFANASYNVLVAETPVFTTSNAGQSLTTDQSSYTDLQTINITFSGVPASTSTWFTIAPQGSDYAVVTNYYYNPSASSSGSFSFPAPTDPGTYVIRCFRDNSYNIVIESAPFTVSRATSSATVSTAAVQDSGAQIVATFTGFPAAGGDWLAVANAGAAASDYLMLVDITTASGSATFASTLQAGNYELRGYFNWAQESQRFVIRASQAFTVSSPITRVSVSSGGAEGNGESISGDISASSNDGRYVVFRSFASNLVAGDTGGFADIFLRDRTSNTTTLITRSSGGTQANASSNKPRISASGRYVVFHGFPTNLFAGTDTNGNNDVFMRDVQSNTTTAVSVNTVGTSTGNGASLYPDVSDDGRYVVFQSTASDLVSGDTNGVSDIFLRDMQTGSTTCVSVNTSGAVANSDSINARISGDGRYVVFVSRATDLISGKTSSTLDVFVRDMQTSTTIRISNSTTGGDPTGDSNAVPEINTDGSIVVYMSWAGNIVENDTNSVYDVFFWSRSQGVSTLVSLADDESLSNDHTFLEGVGVSDDGRYVVWSSAATNLVSGDTNGVLDVFVRDRWLSTTTSLSAGGNGASRRPLISTDGRRVAFESYASNLVSGDTNNEGDVFVVYR